MRNNVLSLAVIMALSLLACSCGSSTNKLQFDGVSCENSDLFSVAKGGYELKEKIVDGDTLLMLKVKLKLEKPTKAEVDDYPEIVLKDKDGMELFRSWDQLELTDADEEKFDKFIAGKLGKEAEFVFVNEFEENHEKAMSESYKFAIVEFALEELDEDELSGAMNSLYNTAKALDTMDDDAEEALKTAGKAIETTGKMLKALEEMDGMW
jgi:hypothetical protein